MPRRKKPVENPTESAEWNEMLNDFADKRAKMERDIAARPRNLAPIIYIGGSAPNLKAEVIEYHDDSTVSARLPDGSVIRRHVRNFV